jgi:SAM-dependent methyltransferase
MVLQRVLHHSGVYEVSRRLIGAEREMHRLVNDLIRPTPGMRLLDLGCGNGRLVPFVPDVEYVGVDNNESYIDAAQRNHEGPRARFLCGDLGEFPADAIGPFDIAVSIGVLHHLDDETAAHAIASAVDRLAPGGRLITMDPCFEPSQRQLARILMALDRGKYVRHPADYRRLIQPFVRSTDDYVWPDVYAFPYTHYVTESLARSE